ncbi:unnamed protein product [Rotaria sordida]|uniref:Thymidine phosphorylase n=1 Tax=Rotaria sordida TaxID=392033 RepID=A0A814VM07_9BILA|nr:unnamed protein product [Rotaria sordida]CAF1150376.1 unnamed protein product [Rotaria sordida]CAF1188988.1 unnamed protein product [Rotaria sordida]CAF1263938.1 unnamed protein product [Rotaria sordida]CAF1458276.1 unnamed protein product [Rotaria sordida]
MSSDNILSIPDLIAKKRDGLELNPEEIQQFIGGIKTRDVQDCHAGAMLMAMFLKGMTEGEICSLTTSMRDSGERLKWPQFRGLVVDKHSTGGIGDKISIPLAPALAACQLKVPMMSGRGLGITGGTLDKLESIPGYRTQLTDEQIVKLISTVGCGIFSQSPKLNPADRYLYSIRDVTATVSSNALIISSILSKKAVEDLDALILDVKYGISAVMKTPELAENLAHSLYKVSEMLGIRTYCYITEMNNPIGYCIGNAIEIQESIDLMKYKSGHSNDLEELVCEQGGRLLLLTDKVKTIEQGREMIRETFKNGSALQKFHDMIIGQGVSETIAKQLISDDESIIGSILKLGDVHYQGISSDTGFIQSIDSFKLGTIVQRLGGGRLKSTDKLDYSVGIRLLKHVGDPIQQNEPWAILYADTDATQRYPKVLDDLTTSLIVSSSSVEPLQRIYKVIGST